MVRDVEGHTRKNLNRDWLIQSILIVILVLLTATMFRYVNRIQGTARIINYTGIVRGGTQRLVKLELADHPNDELIAYLDEILEDLKNGGGDYDLTRLSSEEYHNNLEAVMAYWQELRREIYRVRDHEAEKAELLSMSETYFNLAHELVASTERFSQRMASGIRYLEFCITVGIVVLLVMLLKQTVNRMRLDRKNTELHQTAYLDVHTGLFNKSKCELKLSEGGDITVPTAVIMFDLNCLKEVNDNFGHQEGDRLISNFAQILRWSIPIKHFLGRYGGDEFLVVLDDISKEEVELLIRKIKDEIIRYNKESGKVPISFAYGYALSTEAPGASLMELTEIADGNMYINKQKIKQKHPNNLYAYKKTESQV